MMKAFAGASEYLCSGRDDPHGHVGKSGDGEQAVELADHRFGAADVGPERLLAKNYLEGATTPIQVLLTFHPGRDAFVEIVGYATRSRALRCRAGMRLGPRSGAQRLYVAPEADVDFGGALIAVLYAADLRGVPSGQGGEVRPVRPTSRRRSRSLLPRTSLAW